MYTSPPTWNSNPPVPLAIIQAVLCVIAVSLAVLLGVGMMGLWGNVCGTLMFTGIVLLVGLMEIREPVWQTV
jgi:hypothetical protein